MQNLIDGYHNKSAEMANNWSFLAYFFPFLVMYFQKYCHTFGSSYREQLMCPKLLLKKI